MRINIYDFLIDNDIIHVKVDKLFIKEIKEKIIKRFGSLRKYNSQKLKIYYGTLKAEFRINEYFKFPRLLKIASEVGISKEETFSHIKAFFARGSNTHRELVLPKEFIIDKQFVEGYALYLAEGDNGSNGKTIPRKVRFTNSKLPVVKNFQDWLIKYFPNNNYYLLIRIPDDKVFTEEYYDYLKKYFNLDNFQIKTQICRWKRKKGFVYKICCDQAILIDLILSLENTIKNLCLCDKKLAAAYVRGMMIGEGTAYLNKSRYVRIEMRNEREIKYIYKLFKLLGYTCEPSLRSNRENMWSIYIGAKQLKKFYDEIGFGVHQERQKILEAAVNKILRVNQYV